MIAALNPVAPAGIEIEVAPPAAPPLGASAALVAMVEEWRASGGDPRTLEGFYRRFDCL